MLRVGAIVAAVTLATVPALAQIQQDHLAIAVNSNTTNSFRIVGPSPGAIPGVTAGGGTVSMSTPWSKDFIQTVEFDNAGGVSHNAQGNMLGGNFGGGFTGFEVLNFATNGSGSFQSLWSIKTATGGARTDRGGGLSVSPDNTKIAWAGYDGGLMHVLQYNDGGSSNFGTGAGASVTGWIETSLGNGSGGAGTLTPLAPSVTQATTWLDNNTVLSLNGFGELVTLDVTGATFGTTSVPNTTANWNIAKTDIFAGASGNAQFTGLVYNEQIAPDIIIGSAGFFGGSSSSTEIFVWEKGTFNQLARIDISGSVGDATGREIALDSEGNLYIGGFGNQIVSVIDDFVDHALAGTLTDNSSVNWFVNDFFASFSGLDVASSMSMENAFVLGDFNLSGETTNDDIQAMLDALVDLESYKSANGLSDVDLLAIGDINGLGGVTNDDIQPLLDLLTGSSLLAANNLQSVPEPSAIALFIAGSVGGAGAWRRRTRRNTAATSTTGDR